METSAGTILVVDDNDNNRDMLSRRLIRAGYNAKTANGGPQALELLAKEPFDLILLDIEMPVMNGFEVLRRVRQTHPATKLPIIIATAHDDREKVIEALKLGANDFVAKPIDFPVVLARVQTQLSLKLSVDRIIALEDDLRNRNVLLERANKRMSHSLQLASRMQQSLLPSGPVCVPGVQFAWTYQPCDELAGDILNVFPIGETHVAFYLLDVSGHGVPAALLSTTLSRVLAPVPGQASLVERKTPAGMQPRRARTVVEELNRRFPMTGDQGQYFTLFYAVLELATRELTFVNAGHPPPLHLPKAGEKTHLDSGGFAVGWVDGVDYDEASVVLQPGDRLLLYSDGLTETMNATDEQFGVERLESLFASPGEIQARLDSLLKQTAEFRGNQPVADDISALALEVLAAEMVPAEMGAA